MPEPPPAPEPQPAVTPARPRIQAIVPEAEQQRIRQALVACRAEINAQLAQASRRRLNAADRATVNRVRSFLTLSDQAVQRGDLVQADELSSRALILARGLKP